MKSRFRASPAYFVTTAPQVEHFLEIMKKTAHAEAYRKFNRMKAL